LRLEAMVMLSNKDIVRITEHEAVKDRAYHHGRDHSHTHVIPYDLPLSFSFYLVWHF
jgi:hypothetical protein